MISRAALFKFILCLSLAANLGALAFWVRDARTPGDAPGLVATPHSSELPDAMRTVVAEAVRPDAVTNEALQAVWKDVESSDLRIFTANLRAIGCPEERVRDFLLPELFGKLTAQLNELRLMRERPFWKKSAGWQPPSVTNELKSVLEGFICLSRELLGQDARVWWYEEETRWSFDIGTAGLSGSISWGRKDPVRALQNARHGFDGNWGMPGVSTERLQRMDEIERASEDRIRKLYDSVDRRDRARRDALDPQADAIRAEANKAQDALLTADEIRERSLRGDRELQSALSFVDVTRVQFEKLHDLKAAQDTNGAPWWTDGTPEQAQALSILGTQGYALFRKAADKNYVKVVEQFVDYDLPVEAYDQLYVLRQNYLAALRGGQRLSDARAALREGYDRVVAGNQKIERIVKNRSRYEPFHWYAPPPKNHTLREGDTLEDIADREKVPVAFLMSANGIAPGAELPVGTVILIPLDSDP